MATKQEEIMEDTSTAVNCEKKGHCLHEGTARGSLYCCKCGQYIIAERLHLYKSTGDFRRVSG